MLEPTENDVQAATAGCYAALLPYLRHEAEACGYALAVHGSLARDFDLVAVPWSDEAADAEALVGRLLEASGGALWEYDGNPTLNPHGRRTWAIHIGGGCYIDLSVMPRRQDRAEHWW